MKSLRTFATSLLILTLTLAVSSDSFAKGRGGKRDRVREEVKWEAVPQPVQATITEKAAGGKIIAIEREARRGEVTYEAEVRRANGKVFSIEVAENGKFIAAEEEASVADE
jgi:hypothetical protein